MKFFLHIADPDRIRIVKDALEWTGTLAAFVALEPAYPGLPSGAAVRCQTEDLKYYEDADGRHTDPVDCLGYCDGAYLAAPAPPDTPTGGAALPIGVEMAWPFAVAPEGWMLAHGGTVLRSSVYGALLVAAGCPYGVGDGSTSVNVPDRRGRFLMGAAAAFPLYATGGAASKTLSINEIPAHNHPIYEVWGGPGGGPYNGIYNAALDNTSGNTAYHIQSAGGGQAFSILPPYQTTNIIIFIGES